MKAEKIYIIEKICCRGDISIDKYSFDRERFFSLLDLFDENSFDEDGELSSGLSQQVEHVFGENSWVLEQLIYNMLIGCADFCDDDLTFEQRVQAIKSGKYCAELEESIIAVGFSAKEAKSNLIDLDEDEDW